MSLHISAKLPSVVLGGALVVGLGIGISSYYTTKASMLEIADEHLLASATTAHEQFVTYMDTIERELHSVATSPTTAHALSGFTRSWAVFDNPTEQLQAAYITDNPNPLGEKHLLEQARCTIHSTRPIIPGSERSSSRAVTKMCSSSIPKETWFIRSLKSSIMLPTSLNRIPASGHHLILAMFTER